MGLFFRSEEEKAAEARAHAEYLAQEKKREDDEAAAREQAIFDASPQGQARIARRTGQTIFQIDLNLSQTTGTAGFWLGSRTSTTPVKQVGNAISAIESEGWTLEHVGYVYRMTGSAIQKEFMSSVKESINGGIIGIYIFRASAGRVEADLAN